jgi:hypothetical protein
MQLLELEVLLIMQALQLAAVITLVDMLLIMQALELAAVITVAPIMVLQPELKCRQVTLLRIATRLQLLYRTNALKFLPLFTQSSMMFVQKYRNA